MIDYDFRFSGGLVTQSVTHLSYTNDILSIFIPPVGGNINTKEGETQIEGFDTGNIDRKLKETVLYKSRFFRSILVND